MHPVPHSIILRAQSAALNAIGQEIAPLKKDQALMIVVSAIEDAARHIRSGKANEEEIESYLSCAGLSALYIAKLGTMTREDIVLRLDLLTEQQRVAYALRYEHGLPDWQIAKLLKITEDELVSLMLRALMVLNAVAGAQDK